MTHRARGNFLAFKEAPPWLPVLGEHPPSKRQKQWSQVCLLHCSQSEEMLQPLPGGHLLHSPILYPNKPLETPLETLPAFQWPEEGKPATFFLRAAGASSAMVSWVMLGVHQCCDTLTLQELSQELHNLVPA